MTKGEIMTFANKFAAGAGAVGLSLFAALPAWAQDAATAVVAPAAPAAEAVAPASFVPTAEMVNKGDVAWMLVASALVLMMSVPALALFYGGLVRAKNMLSVLMQVLTIVCVAALVWFSWGYSMAFTSTGTPFPTIVGGLDKAFLAGVDVTTFAATFSNGVYLPEYVFVIFQMTFACITPALIVGAFAERVKFTPLIIFTVLWLTLAYFPIAHMVWYWAGPDFLHAAPTDMGLLWGWGALDFAGGTVVHINAGIAGLVGCLVIGPRLGYNTEPMPPHNLVMTMIGASLLWIGWFGFNAGSGLEANAFGALAFINTLVATAAAGATWAIIEQIVHKKPSLLGGVSGVVAGLVAITPAAGFAHPGTAILLGAGRGRTQGGELVAVRSEGPRAKRAAGDHLPGLARGRGDHFRDGSARRLCADGAARADLAACRATWADHGPARRGDGARRLGRALGRAVRGMRQGGAVPPRARPLCVDAARRARRRRTGLARAGPG